MAVLTSSYEHIQNGQSVDFETTKEYRDDFKNQDIASAQSLITTSNDYLIMDADKLNDLCDTITYMQEIWENDKNTFRGWYFGMTHCEQYDSTHVYKVGSIVAHNDINYFCIADNTTGTWDDSKWIRIGSDDIGLDFIGGVTEGTTPLPEQDKLYIKIPPSSTFDLNPLPWMCDATVVGYTYPNIRYLTENMTPYTGEIYMCDYEGGEG